MFFKDPAEMIFTQIGMPAYFIQGNIFAEILMDITDNFRNILLMGFVRDTKRTAGSVFAITDGSIFIRANSFVNHKGCFEQPNLK